MPSEADGGEFLDDAIRNTDQPFIPPKATRPFNEIIKDFNANPSKWKLIKEQSLPSTNLRNKGGHSLQELFRNEETGEEIVRHTLFRADGSIFELPHPRPYWK
jgi:hypothetical protein